VTWYLKFSSKTKNPKNQLKDTPSLENCSGGPPSPDAAALRHRRASLFSLRSVSQRCSKFEVDLCRDGEEDGEYLMFTIHMASG